ncbi:MAG: caspase family protein [Prevotellaceae bacterium]|nr:caspase family protein [Prevotellaceae bacterium]
MNIILFGVLALALACSKANKPAKYAVVYGISAYPYPGLELSYSANDAVSVSRLLEKQGYEVILRTDSAASMRNIERDFATVARIIDDNDLCLFYFSGHGLFAQTIEEQCDSAVADDYFSMLLYHRFTYPDVCRYIDENALSGEKLSQLFASLPRGLRVGVIDACYSGALKQRQPVVDYTPDDYDGGEIEYPDASATVSDAVRRYSSLKNLGSGIGYTLLASSGSKEVSWDGFFSHSVFSYFFIMSAEQGDLNKDGVITALESYSYIYAACQKYWNTPKQDAEWNFLPAVTGGAEDIILFERPTLINTAILNPDIAN